MKVVVKQVPISGTFVPERARTGEFVLATTPLALAAWPEVHAPVPPLCSSALDSSARSSIAAQCLLGKITDPCVWVGGGAHA